MPVACLAGSAPAGRQDAFQQTVRPFVARHCGSCHNQKLKTANLSLDQYRDAASAGQAPHVWQDVLDKLSSGKMPPPGLPKPRPAEVHAVSQWIESLLARTGAARRPDPGRVTARRLNRFEYNNSIRDLLEIDFHPADDFPADDSGYGFDNIGDVLSLSPVLMEKYLAAAEKIARLAIAADPPMKPTIVRYKAEKLDQVGQRLRVRHTFPVEAEYELRVGLGGRRPDALQTLRLALWLDDRPVKRFDVHLAPDRPRAFEARVPVRAGDHQVRAAILEEESKPSILVDAIEVRGPFQTGAAAVPESHRRVFVCGHPGGEHQPVCARAIVANLARRAWRRPVTGSEVDKLAGFVALARAEGEPFEKAVRVALQAILVSPHFLFRIERDPKPGTAHPISDLELASRLSYFLWSSLPDEELLRRAENRTLSQPAVLDTQVRRMLADPKSGRLAENFGGQWLQLRNLDSVKPDPERFPQFNDDLREAMRRETGMFFEAVMREDRSILDFLDANYTFLNERLARHYGIPGVQGEEFRRVDLDGEQRSGVLTHASVLTVTSYANRTSPVLRGKFLLENFLNAPPPPPPPDAGALDESQVNATGTVREQFEKHRSQPVCASCHVRMDPLGFGFENYDAIGRWRTHEGRFPVDASGTLPGGKSFRGAADLKAILKAEKDAFAECLTEKMLTYALGRGLERYDRPAVRQICSKVAQNGYRFSSLVLEIVHSMPFRMRRGEGGGRS